MRQFDDRYSLPPNWSDNPGVRKRSRIVQHAAEEKLTHLRRRPANIDFFESCMKQTPPTEGRKRVGYFCNMIPVEMIEAQGAQAVRIDCGDAALVGPGEETLSGDICPVAKSSFAAVMDKETAAGQCDAFVLPASCDAKRKLGELLSDYAPTFTLNLPPEQDAGRYGDFVADELLRLADFLKSVTGTKCKRGPLWREIELTQQRTRIVRQLQTLRAEKPAALSVRDFFLMMQASQSGVSLVRWNEEAAKVVAETDAFVPERERLRLRVVLTGAPVQWPNFKVLDLLEECGADVVGDTLCTGGQACYDPVVTTERGYRALIRALGFRYIFASPCPCFVSQGTRLSRVLELVEECKADGVINYALRLCQLFDLETFRLGRVLKDRKIPFANIRTDYSLEDTEQLRVRLEAFLETVEDAL